MPELWIEDRADGAVVKVRAAPGASRERVVGIHGDALKVAVAAAPEKGKANRRILEVIARELDVPARSLELVSGMTSRDKRVLVRGVTRAELIEKLREHLAR
jgi:uncharacterized protein (TIGR00251 family)